LAGAFACAAPVFFCGTFFDGFTAITAGLAPGFVSFLAGALPLAAVPAAGTAGVGVAVTLTGAVCATGAAFSFTGMLLVFTAGLAAEPLVTPLWALAAGFAGEA
jgi:hypothetical protein